MGNDALAGQTDVDQLRTTVQGRRVSREAASLPWIHAKVWLHQNSHLARVIWRRGAATDYSRASCEDFTEEFLRNQRYRLPNHLRRDASVEAHVAVAVEQMERIQELARRDGASLLVVFLPDETQINGSLQTVLLQGKDPGRYDFDMPQPMLSEMLAVRDFTTVDLLPAFRDDPRCLYANNTHWTPEGHAFAAALIAEAVLELGVISSPGQAVPSD
ncbi:MAG: hypothetical protein JRE70_09515 [Deltaproteobacteria bacterium]|nr:hypothetical protein [Deltaproteobacteria bacterium]